MILNLFVKRQLKKLGILICILFFFTNNLVGQKEKTIIIYKDSSKLNICCVYSSLYTTNAYINDTIEIINELDKNYCNKIFGILNGYYIRYGDCNTDTNEASIYNNGKQISQKIYYTSNKLKSHVYSLFNYGVEYGRKEISYYENGIIQSSLFDTLVIDSSKKTLLKDIQGNIFYYQKHGIQYYYFNNGRISKIENYSLGKLNGYYFEFDETSKLLAYGFYKDNKKSGTWYISSKSDLLKKKY